MCIHSLRVEVQFPSNLSIKLQSAREWGEWLGGGYRRHVRSSGKSLPRARMGERFNSPGAVARLNDLNNRSPAQSRSEMRMPRYTLSGYFVEWTKNKKKIKNCPIARCDEPCGWFFVYFLCFVSPRILADKYRCSSIDCFFFCSSINRWIFPVVLWNIERFWISVKI